MTASAEEQSQEQIRNAILKMEGVDNVVIDDRVIAITYDLHLNHSAKIRNELDAITPLIKKTGNNKIFELLSNYCEQNEQAHIESACGWGYYVQNLYLSLHRDDHY